MEVEDRVVTQKSVLSGSQFEISHNLSRSSVRLYISKSGTPYLECIGFIGGVHVILKCMPSKFNLSYKTADGKVGEIWAYMNPWTNKWERCFLDLSTMRMRFPQINCTVSLDTGYLGELSKSNRTGQKSHGQLAETRTNLKLKSVDTLAQRIDKLTDELERLKLMKKEEEKRRK